MANQTSTATVITKINGEQAQQELKKMQSEAKQLRTALNAAYAAGDTKKINQLEKALRANTKEANVLKQSMYDVDKVLKSLDSASVNQLSKALRSATSDLNKMDRSSSAYSAQADKVRVLRAELDKVRASTKSTQSRFQRFSTSIRNSAAAIGTAIAAMAGLTMAFNKYKDLAFSKESSAANLKALTGLDDNSISWLTSQAEQLSTTMTDGAIRITKSSQEILEAYMLVGSAKPELLTNKEALNEVTQQAMILAEAAKMDLRDAVDGVTLSLNMYGASADDAASYTNILAAGSKAGAANVQSQTAAIQKAGVTAASAGIPMEQLVGSIQTLAEKGIKDEIAGTGLKSFFLRLQTGADDTNPKIVGLETALANLAAKNLSAAEIQKRFGLEAFNVASVMINSADKVNAYTAAVTDTNIATEQAAINSDTNQARLDQMRNKYNEIGITLVSKVIPAYTALGNAGLALIAGIKATVGFVKEYGVQLTVIGAAITAFTVKVYAAEIAEWAKVKATKAHAFANNVLIGSFKKLWAAMLANPITAIVAGITAVTAAILIFTKKQDIASKSMETFRDRSADAVAEADVLFGELKNLEKGSDDYNAAQQRIIDKYPDLLQGQIDEQGNLKNIETAYKNVVAALEQKIALQLQEEAITEIITNRIKEQQGALNLLPKAMHDTVKAMAAEGKTAKEIAAALNVEEKSTTKSGSGGYVIHENAMFTGIDNFVSALNSANEQIDKVRKNYEGLTAIATVVEVEEEEDDDKGGTGGGGTPESNPFQEQTDAIQLELNKQLNIQRELRNAGLMSEQEYNDAVKSYALVALNQQLNLVRTHHGEESAEYQTAHANLLDAEQEFNALIDACNKKHNDDKLAAEQAYQDKLAAFKAKYGLEDTQSMQAAELALLEKFYADKLLSEEEYLKAKALIEAKQQGDTDAAMGALGFEKKEDPKAQELAQLEELYAAKLISEEEYLAKKKEIQQKYALEEAASAVGTAQQVLGFAQQAVDTAQNYEMAAIDAKYAKEIAAAGGNKDKIAKIEEQKEQEKAKVKAKYADAQLAIDIAMAVANAAMAAIQCFSQLGPVGGAIALIPLAAMTGLQIATMVKERNAIKAQANYYTGGFTPSGRWDEEQGIVHSDEFVANRHAVANPNIRRVLSIIDQAQQNNTVSRLSAADVSLVSSPAAAPLAASSASGASPNTLQQEATNATLQALNNTLAAGIVAHVSIEGKHGLAEQQAKHTKLKNNTSWQ